MPLFFLACNQLSREDFVSGRFGKIDAAAPELLSPRNEDRLTETAVQNLAFTWSRRNGIGEYTIQIARDALFTSLIAERTTPEPEFKVDGELAGLLKDADFYWRVRGEKNEFSRSARFRVENSNYIFVDMNTTTTGRSGNKGAPLTDINEAIVLALSTKNLFAPPKVREVRVAQGVYPGATITVLSETILRGGFHPQTWEQNPSLYVSQIKAAGSNSIAVSAIGSQNATINGFDIYNESTLANAVGVLVQNSNNIEISESSIRGGQGIDPRGVSLLTVGRVVLRNNTITGGAPGAISNTGVYAQFATDILIDGCTIRPALAESSHAPVGVKLSFAYAAIENSVIYGGNTSIAGWSARAISMEYTNAKISRNLIYTSDPGSNDAVIQGYSMGIEMSVGTPYDNSVTTNGNQSVLIGNNVIIGSYATVAAEAIVTNAANTGGGCGGPRRIYVHNNTIVLRNNLSGGGQAAINMAQTDRCWDIRNNLIRAEAQPSNYSIALLDSQTSSGTNPTLKNNMIILGNWSGHYYRSYTPGPVTYNIFDNGDLNLDPELDPHSTNTVSGNRTTNQAATSVFVSPASSDYRLKAGSAALAMGENLYNLAPLFIVADRAGVARPSSGAWSIGAYE